MVECQSSAASRAISKMKKPLQSSGLLALCTLLSLSAIAQTGTVLGTVFDAKGNPAPGVTVVLQNKKTGFIKTLTTSPEGSFVIVQVPPDVGYEISASTSDGK